MAAPVSSQNVTIRDVADLAGVSSMTVSRALRSPELVAEKTRKQVLSAVDSLGYIPDLAAGFLSSKKSTMVAVMLPSLHFAGHARTVDGLSLELRENGYHLLIADSSYSREEELELLNLILGRRPAAIVMINSVHSSEGRQVLQKSRIPVVETWDLPSDALDSVVGFSHHAVGIALTEHLLEQGHQRIAFIGGDKEQDSHGDQRRQGFIDTLKSRKLDHNRLITIDDAPMNISTGKTGLNQLLEKHPDTTAIICMTDPVAMGAMMEAKRLGMEVPSDLAIAGHGDFDFSEHLVPSLTSVYIDAYEIGKLSAKLIIQKIEGKRIAKIDDVVDIGFSISVRESTLNNWNSAGNRA